ncbi:MAG: UvrD-helicase domain-containing protein [Luteolibacter sp.]
MIKDLIEPVTDGDIEWVSGLLKLRPLDAPRKEFLQGLVTTDVSACPGSGKTTLAVAKLAILARKWKSLSQGVCILSHTNVAKDEIKVRLGHTIEGQRLLRYPHCIETIHGFVNRFLTTPWLHSAGRPLSVIDNDVTAAARRKHLSRGDFRTLSGFLSRKYKSFEGLRLGSADFQNPLVGTDFPSGSHTPMYKLAASALRHAAEEGYFCYDEIFTLAEAMLTQHPALASVLAHRFPFVLVDEMQDTSEQQDSFLRRIFPRDSDSVCIQRVGDPNQAIFEEMAPNTTDPFPDPQRCIHISNSFRFDSSIATIASGFARSPIKPTGLQGLRLVEASALDHRIFLFPDDDTSGVLPAFGRHVITSLPAGQIGGALVTAVGGVHKAYEDVPPGHKHYPKTVSHYWQPYTAGANRPARPACLVEYFHAAQTLATNSGELAACVDQVAGGLIRLCSVSGGKPDRRLHSRPHLQLTRLLASDKNANLTYRDLITRLLLARETLSSSTWDEFTAISLKIAAFLGAPETPPASALKGFLTWAESGPLIAPGLTADPNVYCHQEGDVRLDIKLGSIHQAKGQTHSATLILETFQNAHFLKSLLPWLTGDNQNGTRCNSDAAAQRLLLMYVAMTRPTDLLCLAMQKGSLGPGQRAAVSEDKLKAKGWSIEHL